MVFVLGYGAGRLIGQHLHRLRGRTAAGGGQVVKGGKRTTQTVMHDTKHLHYVRVGHLQWDVRTEAPNPLRTQPRINTHTVAHNTREDPPAPRRRWLAPTGNTCGTTQPRRQLNTHARTSLRISTHAHQPTCTTSALATPTAPTVMRTGLLSASLTSCSTCVGGYGWCGSC